MSLSGRTDGSRKKRSQKSENETDFRPVISESRVSGFRH